MIMSSITHVNVYPPVGHLRTVGDAAHVHLSNTSPAPAAGYRLRGVVSGAQNFSFLRQKHSQEFMIGMGTSGYFFAAAVEPTCQVLMNVTVLMNSAAWSRRRFLLRLTASAISAAIRGRLTAGAETATTNCPVLLWRG